MVATACLYDAVVGHTRHTDVRRSFRHRLYVWLVDLDNLPRLPWPLRPFARFDPRDHLGDPNGSIRGNLDRWLRLRDVDLRGGRVLMLAHARVLGYVFNPLTMYWCYRPDDTLACVVAEVANTYGERHCYLVRPDAGGTADVDKEFHVSPFLPNDGWYRMRLPEPGQRVNLRVQLRRDDQPLLTAVLYGHRRASTPGRLALMLVRYPLAPQRVSVLIRKHGIALWRRGIARTPHHRHAHQEGV